ncbi:MAG: T9SS type A sorting domain-containing protein, partial [Bacteroidales bacterium]|nr:T9SS type A sorting domain-containing protein [Bacteroidales bacterium]
VAPNVFSLEARVKLVIDNCVIDPAGLNRTFGGGNKANHSVFFLTNNQIFRNGHMLSPNDGGWLGSMAWDTLWVENNTFVSSGQDFIGTPFHNIPNNLFIWINHNTFLWHDVWIKKSYNDQNFYFTNNLMHDISLFPELPRWYPFFPDFDQGNTLLCQAAIDTLEINGVTETLPSERKAFWEYNLMYYSPEIQKLPKYAADNGKELTYLIPMVWDENVPLSYTGGVEIISPENSCRESRILADKENWPYMKYNHNWYDIDPLYNLPLIYNINDSAGNHLMGFYRGQFWNEPEAPLVEDLPGYNWNIDEWNGIDHDSYPFTWPRFDGSYNHPDLLTASIEGLPLGDLNWYPEQKKRWFANKEGIESHILSLNEDSYELKDPDSIFYQVSLHLTDSENKPVPQAILIHINDTLALGNDSGQISIDALSGKYLFTISAPGYENVTTELTVSFENLIKTIRMQKSRFKLLFVVVNSSDNQDSIENATISIDGRAGLLLTGQGGTARLDTSGIISYTVSKEGFYDTSGSLEVTKSTVEIAELIINQTGLRNKNKDVEIYPNPANEYIIIKAGDWIYGSVQIIDILGMICRESKIHSDIIKIDLGGLNESIYIVKITKSNKHYLHKISIKR